MKKWAETVSICGRFAAQKLGDENPFGVSDLDPTNPLFAMVKKDPVKPLCQDHGTVVPHTLSMGQSEPPKPRMECSNSIMTFPDLEPEVKAGF